MLLPPIKYIKLQQPEDQLNMYAKSRRYLLFLYPLGSKKSLLSFHLNTTSSMVLQESCM